MQVRHFASRASRAAFQRLVLAFSTVRRLCLPAPGRTNSGSAAITRCIMSSTDCCRLFPPSVHLLREDAAAGGYSKARISFCSSCGMSEVTPCSKIFWDPASRNPLWLCWSPTHSAQSADGTPSNPITPAWFRTIRAHRRLNIQLLQLAVERVIELTARSRFLRQRLQLHRVHVQIACGLLLNGDRLSQAVFLLLRKRDIPGEPAR
jgi:hypothetical protein